MFFKKKQSNVGQQAKVKVPALATDDLSLIPDELLVKIFYYLSLQDWTNLCLVSKRLRALVLWLSQIDADDEIKSMPLIPSALLGSFNNKKAILKSSAPLLSFWEKISIWPIKPANKVKLFLETIFDFNEPETSLIALTTKPLLLVKLIEFAVEKIRAESEKSASIRPYFDAQCAMADICYAVKHLLTLMPENGHMQRCFNQIISLMLELGEKTEIKNDIFFAVFSASHAALENLLKNFVDANRITTALKELLVRGDAVTLRFCLNTIKASNAKLFKSSSSEAKVLLHYCAAKPVQNGQKEVSLDLGDAILKLIKIEKFSYKTSEWLERDDSTHQFTLAHRKLRLHRQLSILKYLFIEEPLFQDYLHRSVRNDLTLIQRCFFVAIVNQLPQVIIDILLECEAEYFKKQNKRVAKVENILKWLSQEETFDWYGKLDTEQEKLRVYVIAGLKKICQNNNTQDETIQTGNLHTGEAQNVLKWS